MIIHHIAYAVKDIDEYIAFYSSVFDVKVSSITDDVSRNVRICFLEYENTKIELVQPINDSSPVSNIVNKKNGGIYHVCYIVKDMNKAINDLVANGALVLGIPQEAPALGNHKVVFIITKDMDILELMDENT